MPRTKRSEKKEEYGEGKIFNSVFAERLSLLVTNRLNIISKKQLASDLKVSVRLVELWKARGSRPDIDNLKIIAEYFGVTVDYLVGKSDVPSPELEDELAVNNYGLSVGALKNLRVFHNEGDINNKLFIEFINTIIEAKISSSLKGITVALRSLDYIIGAHDCILQRDDILCRIDSAWKRSAKLPDPLKNPQKFIERQNQLDAEGEEDIVTILHDPSAQNKELDYRTYQASKEFELLLDCLARDVEIQKRLRKIYEDNNIPKPNYNDSDPNAEWRKNDPIKLYCENKNTENNFAYPIRKLDEPFVPTDKILEKGFEIFKKEGGYPDDESAKKALRELYPQFDFDDDSKI